MTSNMPLPAHDQNHHENQTPATEAALAPVSAASVSSRFEPTRTPRPVSLRTVVVVLLVSIAVTLVLTATVLGLQLLAESFRS